MWVIFLILGLVILLIIALLVIIVVYYRQYWKFLNVPHESPQQLFDLFNAISRHVGSTEHEIEQEHYRQLYLRFKNTGAPFCGFYHMLQPRVLVLDRELVNRILIKDFSNFNSRGVYYNEHDDPLSADLWSRNGSKWKEMRLKIEPIFQKQQMRHLYACINAESEKFMNDIACFVKGYEDAKVGEEDIIDNGVGVGVRELEKQQSSKLEIKRLVRYYVLSSMASSVFGLNTPALQYKYPLEDFEAATELLLHTQRHDVFLHALFIRHQNMARKFGFSITNKNVAKYFTELIEDVVQQREKSPDSEPRHDYLQILIDLKTQEWATHETDEQFDGKKLQEHLRKELIAHVIMFLKGGYEPTANTLAFTLKELALNEWAQQKTREEVQEAMARHNNELTIECIQELRFMGQVISETIRMNPIAPFIVRRALNDYHVPDQPRFLIRKGMYIIIPTYAIHNDSANFADPDIFMPERFSKAENKARERSVWLGFGDGPRGCVGIQFAQLIMRIAIARLLLEYRFSLDSTDEVGNQQIGLKLKVERLKKEQDTGGIEAKVLI